MSNINDDINQTIVSAVNTRVEAEVLKALSSDETFATFVSAALNQKVDKDRYSRDKTTYLNKLLGETIEQKTKEVVAEEIENRKDVIAREVRDALAQSLGVISDALVDGFVAHAGGRYPSIEVKFGRD